MPRRGRVKNVWHRQFLNAPLEHSEGRNKKLGVFGVFLWMGGVVTWFLVCVCVVLVFLFLFGVLVSRFLGLVS